MGKARYEIIKISGLTHKMKNRVREHGNIWMIERREDSKLMITPVNPINHEFPYSTWATVGIDVKIEELT